MTNIYERVGELNKKITKLYEYIGKIEQSFDNLKNQKPQELKINKKVMRRTVKSDLYIITLF